MHAGLRRREQQATLEQILLPWARVAHSVGRAIRLLQAALASMQDSAVLAAHLGCCTQARRATSNQTTICWALTRSISAICGAQMNVGSIGFSSKSAFRARLPTPST